MISAMLFPFLISVSIIGLVAFAIAVTQNPLFIMALLLLPSVPVLFPSPEDTDLDPEDPDGNGFPPQPMGFNATLKDK